MKRNGPQEFASRGSQQPAEAATEALVQRSQKLCAQARALEIKRRQLEIDREEVRRMAQRLASSVDREVVYIRKIVEVLNRRLDVLSQMSQAIHYLEHESPATEPDEEDSNLVHLDSFTHSAEVHEVA